MDKNNLLSLPNVVGFGKGTKIRQGVDTRQPCLTVFVRRKVAAAALAEPERVPPEVEGEATDVVEVGEVSALVGVLPEAATEVREHARRHRPLVGGISCFRSDFPGYVGTLGLPLAYQGDTPVLLSNNHVIAHSYDRENPPAVGEPVRQPALADLGTEEDYVARLLEWEEIGWGQAENRMDAAIARLEVEASPEMLGIGEYSGLAEPELGMAVKKSGRASGVTEGEVANLEATIGVSYGGTRVARFTGQVILRPALLRPGDSGAVLVAGDRLVALGFAASSSIAVATPIGRVFDRFGLRLRTEQKPMEPPPPPPPAEPLDKVAVEVAVAPIRDRLTIIYGWEAGRWLSYYPGYPGYSTLKQLIRGKGYWVNMREAATWPTPPFTYRLEAGQNLIGWQGG